MLKKKRPIDTNIDRKGSKQKALNKTYELEALKKRHNRLKYQPGFSFQKSDIEEISLIKSLMPDRNKISLKSRFPFETKNRNSLEQRRTGRNLAIHKLSILRSRQISKNRSERSKVILRSFQPDQLRTIESYDQEDQFQNSVKFGKKSGVYYTEPASVTSRKNNRNLNLKLNLSKQFHRERNLMSLRSKSPFAISSRRYGSSRLTKDNFSMGENISKSTPLFPKQQLPSTKDYASNRFKKLLPIFFNNSRRNKIQFSEPRKRKVFKTIPPHLRKQVLSRFNKQVKNRNMENMLNRQRYLIRNALILAKESGSSNNSLFDKGEVRSSLKGWDRGSIESEVSGQKFQIDYIQK